MTQWPEGGISQGRPEKTMIKLEIIVDHSNKLIKHQHNHEETVYSDYRMISRQEITKHPFLPLTRAGVHQVSLGHLCATELTEHDGAELVGVDGAGLVLWRGKYDQFRKKSNTWEQNQQ